MRKIGHDLAEIAEQQVPSDLVEGLQSRFSITTAEELIAAAARSGDKLREALAADEKDWNDLVAIAGNAVGPEERQRLSRSAPQRPGGAKLNSLSPEELRKHAPGLTTE